jgi:hypothetical protein
MLSDFHGCYVFFLCSREQATLWLQIFARIENVLRILVVYLDKCMLISITCTSRFFQFLIITVNHDHFYINYFVVNTVCYVCEIYGPVPLEFDVISFISLLRWIRTTQWMHSCCLGLYYASQVPTHRFTAPLQPTMYSTSQNLT